MISQPIALADDSFVSAREDDTDNTLPTARIITGDAGDNILDGRGGATAIMTGLGGNDTYFVDDAGDVVNEVVGEGTDRVVTSVDYALNAGQSIEPSPGSR